jgi:tetratricopeptide (TPR) repeat protein
MATHILGTKETEKALEELILEKTEGVPFFIEEFIKSLKDLKIIERKENAYQLSKDIQKLAIPSTIQDVIMARVDSLPERAKEVLQTGSVIEREFSYPLINRVTGLPEKELLSHLSVLKDSELLYERGIYPQSNYIFKHALTREVVYDSILAKRKKKLHEEIGNTIEELYEDNLSEHYEVLSEHYFLSENYKKAAEFSRIVAKKAGRTGSLTEAIAYNNKSISSLEKIPQSNDIQKAIIDARTTLGLHLIEMNYFHEAREAIQHVTDLALEFSYNKRVCQIFIVIGVCHYCIEEDFPKAFESLKKALEISKKIKDHSSLALANYWSGYAFSLNCEFSEALHYIQNSLDFQVEKNNITWISVMKGLMSYLGYYQKGDIDLAYNTSREVIPIAEESGEKIAKVFAYSCYGVSCYGKGFLQEAKKNMLMGNQANEGLNQFYMNVGFHQFLGDVYCEMADYASAKSHYEMAIEFLRGKRVYPSWLNMNRAALAKAKVLNRERNIDLESLYTYVSVNRVKMYEGLIQRLLAEILMTIKEDSISEVETWVLKAIEADKRNNMMWHLGKDYALYAELFKRRGDKLKAQENLGKAIEILKECGADGWVTKAEKDLATLL